jgi:glycosyltransferase involved in cell wall biosynthesis
MKKNAKGLSHVIKKANVIVIDDPQASGLIPHIRKINPQVKIIYRSHIQLEADLIATRNTPQYITWKFLWSSIKESNVFVSHPVEEFVPKNVPKKKVVFMPAVTDQLDGLNKKLSKQQLNYYLEMFNNILRESNQKPLDITRPYITQIARFDPSKGIIDVIEAYRALRRRMEKRGVDKKIIPQLVIAGHSAIDDPEGAPILIETMNIIHMYRYRPYADDIKIARLIHSDQLLNALLRASHIAVQLSYKEGFEVKVTEAIAKGKPVIAYNSGGIPLQINHGRNGFVVEPGDTDRVAHYLYKLFVNTSLYREMSRRCVRELNQDFFTVANATKFLQLSNDLLHK